MFENFSFDSPRSPALSDGSNAASTSNTSRSVSPCSTTYPPPRYSITDLSAQFDQQRIRQDSQICYQSCDSYANSEDDAGWSLDASSDEGSFPPVSRSRTFPMRAHSPSRRSARQVNTRLLCSASHHNDIAALVARMVQSGEQCSVTPPQSLSRPSSRDQEDEGYDSSEEPLASTSRRSSVATLRRGMDYRRASELRTTGACVSKATRLQKDKKHKRLRSGEKS